MGQTCQDDTITELSRPIEPEIMTRMVEKGIQQEQLDHSRPSDKQLVDNLEYYVVYFIWDIDTLIHCSIVFRTPPYPYSNTVV